MTAAATPSPSSLRFFANAICFKRFASTASSTCFAGNTGLGLSKGSPLAARASLRASAARARFSAARRRRARTFPGITSPFSSTEFVFSCTFGFSFFSAFLAFMMAPKPLSASRLLSLAFRLSFLLPNVALALGFSANNESSAASPAAFGARAVLAAFPFPVAAAAAASSLAFRASARFAFFASRADASAL